MRTLDRSDSLLKLRLHPFLQGKLERYTPVILAILNRSRTNRPRTGEQKRVEAVRSGQGSSNASRSARRGEAARRSYSLRRSTISHHRRQYSQRSVAAAFS